MSVHGRIFSVPTSIHGVPSKGLVDKPLIMDKYPSLSYSNKDERLRMYHVRLDLMHTLVSSDQANLIWQIEAIIEWINKAIIDGNKVMYKVNWIGGDMQWVSIDTLRLHDPYSIVKYALQNKLTNKPGWE